jgi:hypothetical protein
MNAKQYLDGVEQALKRSLTEEEQRKLARMFIANVSIDDDLLAFKG